MTVGPFRVGHDGRQIWHGNLGTIDPRSPRAKERVSAPSDRLRGPQWFLAAPHTDLTPTIGNTGLLRVAASQQGSAHHRIDLSTDLSTQLRIARPAKPHETSLDGPSDQRDLPRPARTTLDLTVSGGLAVKRFVGSSPIASTSQMDPVQVRLCILALRSQGATRRPSQHRPQRFTVSSKTGCVTARSDLACSPYSCGPDD